LKCFFNKKGNYLKARGTIRLWPYSQTLDTPQKNSEKYSREFLSKKGQGHHKVLVQLENIILA
jgi:hypothetical protein